MLRDGCPIAEPNPFMMLDVREQPRQRSNPAGATDDPTVKADGDHAWAPFSSHTVEPVERIPTVCEEVFAGAEIAPTLQAAVVGVEAIRHNEMPAA